MSQPLIQNMPPSLSLDPFDDAVLADPRAAEALLRETGPVVWLERYQIYAMARFAEVSVSLRDNATFCSGRGVGLADFAMEPPWRPPSLLLEADPPLHDQMRAVLNPIVGVSILNGFRPRWRELAERLIAAQPSGQRFDAIAGICRAFPLEVFPDAVGITPVGREHLLPYASLVFDAFGPRNARLVEAMANAGPTTAWIGSACKRSSIRADGLAAEVFAAVDAGEITEDEAERLVRSFLTAGVDTTINGLAGLVLGLASSPDQWEILRDDRGLVRSAVEEAIRWASPVRTFFRTTTRDVAVGNVVIPEGKKVLLFLGAANHDPRRWENPECFDVRRKAGGHVGFGLGIHGCLGQMVARVEMEVVLNAMLDCLRSIELAAPPEYRVNSTLRSIERLPISVTFAS